jgi:ABC-type nitrate/sulfonate/bicarbonate transport system substrate-binding protein
MIQPSRRLWSWKLFVALLAGLALVAAACGSDDDSSSEEAPEEAATEAAAEATDDAAAEDPAEDAAAAEADAAAERCAANEAAGKITWVSSFDYAAAAGIIDVIAADSQGYFEELCLDVELISGVAPSNGAIVAGGEAQFSAAGSFSELVNNNVNGEADLVAIGQYGHTAIEALTVPADGEVQELTDIPGTTMGVKGDIPYSIQALLAQEGVERGTYEELLLDGFDPVAHLELGIDELPVYKSNEPAQLAAAGVDVIMFDPLDFDVPASFGVVFTSQSFLDDHPQAVEDFMAASLKGFDWAVENPDEAVNAAFELIDAAGNQFFLVQEAESFRWETESGIVIATTPVGLEIGMVDLIRLGEEIERMTELGIFEAEPDWGSMVDSTIVESIYG